MEKYCAVCHTDAVRNGGLSLQHFDAQNVAPSLAAMMVSKLTSGVSLETAKSAAYDSNAAALVARKMKGGAMGAAGIPNPRQDHDRRTDRRAHRRSGPRQKVARESNPRPVHPGACPDGEHPQEATAGKNCGEAAMYRLILTCSTATHEGGMQLAWAPMPKTGTLSAVVDGKTPVTYEVEGKEKMGNGSQATTGPAAISLAGMSLPAQSLRIADLFPNESVEFPFGTLTQAARQSLTACIE